MPIDQRTERRIAARDIGSKLGVAVDHLKVGVRLVGAGTLVVVGAGALLAGFFGCYFGLVVPLKRELQTVETEAQERDAEAEKARALSLSAVATLRAERDSAVELAAKADDLRARSEEQHRTKNRLASEAKAERSTPEQPPEPPPVEDVEFWRVASAFATNRVVVEASLVGRRIRFRATIVEIERDFFGQARLVVRPTDAEKNIARTTLVQQVKGYLLFARDQEPSLFNLVPGNEVVVETTLTGGSALGTPQFSGSVIVK